MADPAEKDATAEMEGADPEGAAGEEPGWQENCAKWACCVSCAPIGCDVLGRNRKATMYFILLLQVIGLAFCIVGCVGLSDNGDAIKNVPWAKYTVKTSKKDYDVYMNLEALRIDFPSNNSARSLLAPHPLTARP